MPDRVSVEIPDSVVEWAAERLHFTGRGGTTELIERDGCLHQRTWDEIPDAQKLPARGFANYLLKRVAPAILESRVEPLARRVHLLSGLPLGVCRMHVREAFGLPDTGEGQDG